MNLFTPFYDHWFFHIGLAIEGGQMGSRQDIKNKLGEKIENMSKNNKKIIITLAGNRKIQIWAYFEMVKMCMQIRRSSTIEVIVE